MAAMDAFLASQPANDDMERLAKRARAHPDSMERLAKCARAQDAVASSVHHQVDDMLRSFTDWERLFQAKRLQMGEHWWGNSLSDATLSNGGYVRCLCAEHLFAFGTRGQASGSLMSLDAPLGDDEDGEEKFLRSPSAKSSRLSKR